MKKVLTLIAAAFVSATAFAGEFADISIADLKKAIEDRKVTIIDVNGSSSFKAGHVPTAIDFSADKADLAKKLPADKDALVVAYCGGPSCSAYKAAATAAEKLGYKNIKHLSAGISGWKSAGEKLETPK
jgi:rhodanese-related sulfurtransferase